MQEPRRHVFISYAREKAEDVERLAEAIRRSGVRVWLDRDLLQPGTQWRNAMRRAIEQGAFFLACFSAEYSERTKSYMSEELNLAIDELRRNPSDQSWFIPVKLGAGESPDIVIGAGEKTMRHLQWVDLSVDWDRGVSDILRAVGKAKQAPPQSGSAVVLDPTHPIEDRIKQLSHAWIESGRGADWLISGKAFFLAYCWGLKHKIASTESRDHDADMAAFMDASLAFIGGLDGWSKMLADQALCLVCNDHFRLENIMICTGCMNYFCGWQTERCVCRCGEMVG